jgi:hypothetical protein
LTATADKYVVPFTSEIRREADGGYNECTDASTVMAHAAWTLGESLELPDGSRRNPNDYRNALRGKAGFSEAGGLTLHDANDMLRAIDPELPPLPRYAGQELRKGQSSEGATLRLTFDELKAQIIDGKVAMVCGNPIGVKDGQSAFRRKTRNDRFPHVAVVYRGTQGGATLLDPMADEGPGFKGEHIDWDELRQYTEAKDPKGDRYFGSATAVACAVVPMGGQTQAARVAARSLGTIARLNDKVAAQKEQTTLTAGERDQAIRERDQARRDLAAAQKRIDELEAVGQPDCIAPVNAERMRVLDLLSGRFDELVAEVR